MRGRPHGSVATVVQVAGGLSFILPGLMTQSGSGRLQVKSADESVVARNGFVISRHVRSGLWMRKPLRGAVLSPPQSPAGAASVPGSAELCAEAFTVALLSPVLPARQQSTTAKVQGQNFGACVQGGSPPLTCSAHAFSRALASVHWEGRHRREPPLLSPSAAQRPRGLVREDRRQAKEGRRP